MTKEKLAARVVALLLLLLLTKGEPVLSDPKISSSLFKLEIKRTGSNALRSCNDLTIDSTLTNISSSALAFYGYAPSFVIRAADSKIIQRNGSRPSLVSSAVRITKVIMQSGASISQLYTPLVTGRDYADSDCPAGSYSAELQERFDELNGLIVESNAVNFTITK